MCVWTCNKFSWHLSWPFYNGSDVHVPYTVFAVKIYTGFFSHTCASARQSIWKISFSLPSVHTQSMVMERKRSAKSVSYRPYRKFSLYLIIHVSHGIKGRYQGLSKIWIHLTGPTWILVDVQNLRNVTIPTELLFSALSAGVLFQHWGMTKNKWSWRRRY